MKKPDLSKLNKVPKTQWSEQFTSIYGNYSWLNETPIHYFLTTVSIQNLWDDIRLMGEISGVEKWGFEALFQRVVREEWVTLIKTQYLSSRERFKFFPPITIALLPCESNRPTRDYGECTAFDFGKVDSPTKASLAGLEIEFPTNEGKEFPPFGSPAFVRWDRSRFMALAIDGQHRISALRKLIPRTNQEAAFKDVPATFLVFDPNLPIGRDLIQVTREIFIDINKNAKTVDDSRLILLDDRNFYKGLTRKLILQAYPDGENSSVVQYENILDELDFQVAQGVPQELVDTAAGRDAADIGKLKDWQFTSAFILNRAIQYFAFENRFDRFEEICETGDFSGDSDLQHEKDVAERREVYENGFESDDEVISDDDMLSFRPSTTAELVNRAASRHKGLWLGPLTAFCPYRQHIENFSNLVSSDDGEALRSLMLSEASIPGKATFETQVANDLKADEAKFKRVRKLLAKASRPEGWEKNLVWYSVFQRGLFYQPILLRKALEAARGAGFTSRQEFAYEYVFALNSLYSEGWLDRERCIKGKGIWNGVAMKIGESGEIALDGSDGAARRTGSMIRLMASAVLLRSNGGPSALKSLEGKHGISSAISAVKKGVSRHLRALDSIKGTAKDMSEYNDPSHKLLFDALKQIADPGEF
jgi:hypothetical protein